MGSMKTKKDMVPHRATLPFSGELDPLATKGEMTSRQLLSLPHPDLTFLGQTSRCSYSRAQTRDNQSLGCMSHQHWALWARGILSLLLAHSPPSLAFTALLHILQVTSDQVHERVQGESLSGLCCCSWV